LAAKFGSFEVGELVLPASLLLTAVIVWNFCSWRLAGRIWFEPYGLFLLSASLFNGGQGLLEVFHLNQNGILAGRLPPEFIAEALYLVALGLGAFHLGALAALQRTTGRMPVGPSTQSDLHGRLKAARLVGYACLGISIGPMILVLRDTLTTALTQGYSGLFGRSELLPGTLPALASFMIPGTMFLVAGSRKRRTPLLVAGVLAAVYAGAMLIAGSRSPSVMLLVSFAWNYERSVRRLPRLVAVGLGILLLISLPSIAALRDTQGTWQTPGRIFDEVVSHDSPLIAAVSEMGGSLVTVVHTIRLIPSVRPFDFGGSYVYALSTAIPNVGWDIHPAISHGLFSDWLIKTVDPDTANRGGGLGYSFIAEVFANVGWYGTPFLLAGFGFLLMRLFQWGTDTSDSVRHALLAAFLAYFLMFVRGESIMVVRSLIWYSVLPYVAVCLITPRRVRGRLQLRGTLPSDT